MIEYKSAFYSFDGTNQEKIAFDASSLDDKRKIVLFWPYFEQKEEWQKAI